ncbi:hypothetical protein ScPMuIL_005877, partial [Solemya velum]
TLGGCLDENSHCYTLEVSFFSYQTNTCSTSMPYTEEGYMKLGRNLARTFLDYYKLNGYISAKPSSSIVPKPGMFRLRERLQAERFGDPPSSMHYEDRYGSEERTSRRSYNTQSGFAINSSSTLNDSPTSIRLQLRERDRRY